MKRTIPVQFEPRLAAAAASGVVLTFSRPYYLVRPAGQPVPERPVLALSYGIVSKIKKVLKVVTGDRAWLR